jgi:4-amino-4-deoxy-L-arabinose transferase-like glycosyltransferase
MPRPAPAPAKPLAHQTEPSDPYFRIALIGVAGIAILRLLWLAGRPIDLYPDEAQYWIWAQHLDWGYYSKPPLVAWMIAATTALFGENDLAIKIGAPLTYVATSLVVFQIAARLYDRRAAAWAAIAFATLPAVSLSALIISTDVPLLLFWAIATYGFVRAREPGAGASWWVLTGVACGLGLLSKYFMAFWPAAALLHLLIWREERAHLRRFGLSLASGFIVYLPNLIWNWAHGFASYRHTGDDADLHGLMLHPLPVVEFLGSQFGVFGPVFFAVLLWIGWRALKAGTDRQTGLLLILSLPFVALFSVLALLSRAQPNWAAPAYVTGTVLVVGWLGQRRRDGWVQWSVVLHMFVAVLALGARDLTQAAGWRLPGKLDPLHRVRGWASLGRSLSEIRATHPELPLLGDDRELMAGIIYYMQPHPLDMQIWNPAGHVRNGFEMDQSLPDRPGGDYLWITNRQDPTEITDRFEAHEQAGHITVPLGPGLTREATVYVLRGFMGYHPATAPASPPETAPDAAG